MAKNATIKQSELFEAYAYALFVDSPNPEKSAAIKKQMNASYDDKIRLIDDVAQLYFQINNDCDDDRLIEQGIEKLEKILPLLPAADKQNVIVRNKLLNRMYDFEELAHPRALQNRFNLLKRMVADIKSNHGEFDADPLNSTAQRLNHFFRDISAKDRFTLILTIEKKLFDKERYNISHIKKRFHEEYQNEAKQQRKIKKDIQTTDDKARYDQIRNRELPAAESSQEKINLYNELLKLVNVQDWTRGRKFAEKKTIYNHLISLYDEVGDIQNKQIACKNKAKFAQAAERNKEAAVKRGYYSKARSY